ncbi:MAG: orotidine-5'-phosphate decarboxylase [Bacteroidia bacterium]
MHLDFSSKKSFLCVGLDTDLQKIPLFMRNKPHAILDFNRQIIEATLPYTLAYKINTAFYECLGIEGWNIMEKTLELIPSNVMKIADAKRGDIGNTSKMYAKTFFETFDFDAITVAPYMGEDSVMPFLEYENKWVFLLALTSNAGAKDFQWMKEEDTFLYEKVINTSQTWAKKAAGNLGYVVGATRSEQLTHIRSLIPDSLLLVPGVGAQGGDLHEVCKHGKSAQGGLLINSSRGIIYASQDEDFASRAKQEAQSLQNEMKSYFV